MARTAYKPPSDNESKAIRHGIHEIANSFKEIEAEKEHIKNIKDNLKESTGIPPSVLTKLIKAYIKQDLTEQREEFDLFEELYQGIMEGK